MTFIRIATVCISELQMFVFPDFWRTKAKRKSYAGGSRDRKTGAFAN